MRSDNVFIAYRIPVQLADLMIETPGGIALRSF
jgi:hypothetical protein